MTRRRVFLALAAAVMTVVMIAGSVLAGNLTPGAFDDGKIHLEKSFTTTDNGNTGNLRIEAYSEGEKTALEVVLVLDTSDSMMKAVNGTTLSKSELDTSKPVGYYATSVGAVYYGKNAWRNASTGLKCASNKFFKTRLGALIDSANAFVDQLAKNAQDTGIDHKVGVVSFNASAHLEIGLASVLSNADAVHKAINNIRPSLEYNLATVHGDGIAMGASMFSGSKKVNPVMVLFTDGEPFRGFSLDPTVLITGKTLVFQDDVAGAAINEALVLKTAGVKVYTIGMFDDPTSDIEKYLNAISSNYPNASSPTVFGRKWRENMGGKTLAANYYSTASSEADLGDSFASIADALVSGYTKNSVIKDYIAGGYKLNSTAADVKLYTADYNASTGTFGAEQPYTGSDVKVTVKDNCVEVTGFDYADYWCGAGALNGKKLIVEIPVKFEIYEGEELVDVATNGEGSGIYKDEDSKTPDGEFDNPTIDFFVIKNDADNSEKKVPIISSDPESEYGDKSVNLLDYIAEESEGVEYYYGGYYTVDEATGEKKYGTEAGMSYIPKKGETVVIHDVSTKYLKSRSFITYFNENNGVNEGMIVSTLLVTALDSANYKAAGFMVKNGPAKSSEMTAEFSAERCYRSIRVNSGNTTVVKTVKDVFKVDNSDAIFAVVHADNCGVTTIGEKNGVNYTYYPYYVTFDGIKVSSHTKRRTTYDYDLVKIGENPVKNFEATIHVPAYKYESLSAGFGFNSLGGLTISDYVIDLKDVVLSIDDEIYQVSANVEKVVDEKTSPVAIDADVKVENGKVKVNVNADADIGTMTVVVETGDGKTTVDVKGTQKETVEEKADYWEICKSILAKAVKTIKSWSYNVTVDANDVVSVYVEWTDKSGQTYKYELKGIDF